MKVQYKQLNEDLIIQGIRDRFNSNSYHMENYNSIDKLMEFYPKARKEVINYVLDNTDKGKATITDGKEVISHLSAGYYHDEYNQDELIEYFGVHEVFCVMTRLYNLSRR